MVHAAAYGTTIEQFAQVAVKNHHHATMNPKAMYQIETPLDQVLASEMIAWPLTKLMCSANVDGAAATILVSERKARELEEVRAKRAAEQDGVNSTPTLFINGRKIDTIPQTPQELDAAIAGAIKGGR